jgi:hypothetical protein
MKLLSMDEQAFSTSLPMSFDKALWAQRPLTRSMLESLSHSLRSSSFSCRSRKFSRSVTFGSVFDSRSRIYRRNGNGSALIFSPLCGRMASHLHPQQLSPTMAHYEKGKQALKRDGWNHAHVDGSGGTTRCTSETFALRWFCCINDRGRDGKVVDWADGDHRRLSEENNMNDPCGARCPQLPKVL